MPNVKKYCLGVEISSVHQMIKKLKMDHLWVYTLYPFLSPAATAAIVAKYYKKTKRACQSLKFGMQVLDRAINIL